MTNNKQNIIPKGFKQTKLGLIPEDWELKKLIELSTRIGDGIHSTPKYDIKGDYYFVNGNNLINGDIHVDEKTKKVNQIEYKNHKRPINKETTIFLSINGTIGNLAFYNNEKIVLGKSAAYINCSKEINKLFLFNLLKEEKIINYFNNELTGSTIKNLSLKSIRNTPIPFPPLPEQQKIAKILSTWDKAIEKQNQLIEKKKEQKKGLMQELLSPKEGWEEVRLGEVLIVKHGKNQKKVVDKNGEYPILGTGGLMGYSNSYLWNKPSVLIGRKGTIDKPQYMDTPFWTVDTLFYTDIKENVIPKWLYYKFWSINWRRYNEASGVPSLSASTISSIKIQLPQMSEQQKATKILSSADKELELLEKQLEKLKEQKKGLMQVLLSGQKRVKTDN